MHHQQQQHQQPAAAFEMQTCKAPCDGTDTIVVVQILLGLPSRIWTGLHSWPKSPAAAIVFRALAPMSADVDKLLRDLLLDLADPSDASMAQAKAQRFNLLSCFKALASCIARAPAVPMYVAAGAPEQSAYFADMPHEVVIRILKQLGSWDLARVSCTCKYLHSVGWDAVPGLKLNLYPHQVGIRVH